METLRMLSKTPGSSEYEAEVERLLSCPICLEVYSKPVVILPCQHNLCRKCANDVFQNRGTPMGSGGRFRCPTCRYEVMLDRHGVYGLQRNILVENIIDMYQSESKKPFRKAEVLMCDEHEEEKVNIFCISCQKPTCSLCKVFGQHGDCTVSPMEKVYKDHKVELSSAISMLVAGNDHLQNIISKTEDMAAATEGNIKVAQNEVSSSFDQLYAVLEQRKQTMLSQITAASQEKSEILQSMLTEYGVQLQSSSKLVEEALSLLEEPSHSQFLLISRDLINRVTSTARDAEVPKPPQNIDSVEAFAIDLSEYVNCLKQISFADDDTDSPQPLSISRKESVGAVTGKNPDDIFQARLLLPNTVNTAEEAAVAARVEKTENDDENTPSTSKSFNCEGIADRKDSYSDCSGLDQLDADVKAIAERYLTGRTTTRRRSHACSQGDTYALNDARVSSPSDEQMSSSSWTERQNSVHDIKAGVDNDNIDHMKSALGCKKYSSPSISDIDSPKDTSRASSPTISYSRRSSSNKAPRKLRFQTDLANSFSNQESKNDRSTASRRNIAQKKRQKTYATHRRRTWSHLLDKKL